MRHNNSNNSTKKLEKKEVFNLKINKKKAPLVKSTPFLSKSFKLIEGYVTAS